MNRPLNIRDLGSIENTGRHKELDRLAKADVVAREMLVDGPLPHDAEEWAILERSVAQLGGDEFVMREWSYLIGLAAGLRLARSVDADLEELAPLPTGVTFDTVGQRLTRVRHALTMIVASSREAASDEGNAYLHSEDIEEAILDVGQKALGELYWVMLLGDDVLSTPAPTQDEREEAAEGVAR